MGQRDARLGAGLALAHAAEQRHRLLVGGVHVLSATAAERDGELRDGALAQVGRREARVQPGRAPPRRGLPIRRADLVAGEEPVALAKGVALLAGLAPAVPPLPEVQRGDAGAPDEHGEDEEQQPLGWRGAGGRPDLVRVAAVDDERGGPLHPAAAEAGDAPPHQEAAEDGGEVDQDHRHGADRQRGEEEPRP